MSAEHSSGAERLEQERRRVQLASGPARPIVEQFGARDAEQEDRRVTRHVGNVLDEVDEDWLGPLQVVDDDDLRPLGRPRLEEPPEGELRLRRRRADDGVGLGADRDQDLDQRPVGDPLAVREAPPAQDVGRVADALEEVRDEARLPDPGRAEQREQPARAVGDGVLVVAPQPLSLALSADERRLEVPGERGGAADHLEEAEGLDGLRLALQRERLDGLDLHRVAHEHASLSADQRLSRRSRLLEARSDVDGVARDERLALAADDDLAGVDADPRLEPVLGDRGAHLRGSTDRAQGIVLMRDRDPEDRHDRVADELLHRSAVALDDRAQILEVAAHASAQRLGIGRLPQRRGADEVAEEDGDNLALLAGCDRLGGERRAAHPAQAEAFRVFLAAAWANDHAQRLRRRHGENGRLRGDTGTCGDR